MSYQEIEELKTQVDLVKKDFIHPNISPSGAPVQTVKKKDSSLRTEMNYRPLNRITSTTDAHCPALMSLLTTCDVPNISPS